MRTFLRLLALTGVAVLTACGGDGTISSEQGHVRMVNATTRGTPLELVADTGTVVSNVAPYTASGYGDLKASDTHTLDVRDNGATLVTTNTTVARKKHQTVVAYTSGGTNTAVTILDDEESTPGSGRVKFRFFNTATADAGKVDVYLVTTGCDTLESTGVAPVSSAVDGLEKAYA